MLAPSEAPLIGGNTSNPIPKALGVLSGFLRPLGYSIDLHDLNSVLEQKQLVSSAKDQYELFYDKDLVLSYLNGDENQAFANILSNLLADISIASYDLIGISCGADYSFLEIHFGFVLGRYIRDHYQKPVVFGGNNISYLYIFESTFRELWNAVLTNFDFVVKGAGETALLEIIAALNAGRSPEDILRAVKGLIRWEDGRAVANPEHAPRVIRPDWDGLPLERYWRYVPAVTANSDKLREDLVQIFKWPDSWLGSPGQLANRYNQAAAHRRDIATKLVIPYIFNYNCPYRCAYCTQSDSERGPLIQGDPDEVLADIEFLMHHYDSPYFNFLNNAFNISAKFVDQFCTRVIEKGLHFYWSDCARFNANLTFERLRLMRQAGCQNLTFGFDTASPKLLGMINKNVDMNRIPEVMQWCSELGIWVNFEIIVGLPTETDEDFMETYHFVSKYKALINCLFVNEYFIVPNSLIGRYPERYGIEIIASVTYDQILKRNKRMLIENTPSLTRNAKIYKFNETGSRSHEEVRASNKKRIALTNRIQNKEFAEVEHLYRMLLTQLSPVSIDAC